jgi:hypothetical protein
MIHTKEDFYNKVATDIRAAYFSEVKHGYTDNEDYHAANYAIELFNNGCTTYRKLIGSLAKCCNDHTYKIHAIVEKHIVSFGSYQYKPKATA